MRTISKSGNFSEIEDLYIIKYDDIFVLLTKQSVDIPQLDYSEC